MDEIFRALQERFPNPERVDLREIVDFFMDMLRENAPEIDQMTR